MRIFPGVSPSSCFVDDCALHWSTMETYLFDTSFLKYDPSPPSAFFRPSLISAARPLTFPMPPPIHRMSSGYCGNSSVSYHYYDTRYDAQCIDSIYTDYTKKFLQSVYENQHTISKHLFTRMTGKPRDTCTSTWLVNYIKFILSCTAIISFSVLITIAEKSKELLKTLVMWEKLRFSEGPQSSHEIGHCILIYMSLSQSTLIILKCTIL